MKHYEHPSDYHVDPDDGTVYAIDDMSKKQLRATVRQLDAALTDAEHMLMDIKAILDPDPGLVEDLDYDILDAQF